MAPPDAAAAPTWAAVVAHYDAQGRVAEHLHRTLRLLHARGAQVCFVSTHLSDASAQALQPYARVIVRDNVGYDFWSYKVGIEALGPVAGLTRLLLLNSSMVMRDAAPLLDRLAAGAAQADLLGLTLSHEGRPHLQSYWLSFEGEAILQSEAFTAWWRDLTCLNVRDQVVAQQELGLSAHFVRAGFRLGALHQPSRADQLSAVLRAAESGFLKLDVGPQGPVALDPVWAERLNPTMYAWDSVLHQLGVLKLELLLRNPHRINLLPLVQRLRQDPALGALVADAVGGPVLPGLLV